MTDATLLPFDLPSVARKKLTVDFAGGNQSSDGGLLLLRQAERKLGVIPRTNPFASCEFATIRERLIKIGARVERTNSRTTKTAT